MGIGTLRIARNGLALFIIIIFFSLCNVTLWAVTRDTVLQRRRIQRSTRFWIRTTLNALNISYTLKGAENLRNDRNHLIIANHISYVDVLLLYALRPLTGVASVEVEVGGLDGFLAKMGGSLFIERRSVRHLRGELAKVTALLRDRFDVLIFPEGTTTDGKSPLKPFRTAFFAAAADAGTPILPVAICYETIDGRPAREDDLLDAVAYYGDISFLSHAKKFLALKSITATITVLPPVEAASAHRDQLGVTLREQIQTARDAI
ncbi:MAG TPA: lysophospholipid acyltransferase family protein [bacterium]|nr:lysophospholipid acyltransferase family protein [bacterium]